MNAEQHFQRAVDAAVGRGDFRVVGEAWARLSSALFVDSGESREVSRRAHDHMRKFLHEVHAGKTPVWDDYRRGILAC